MSINVNYYGAESTWLDFPPVAGMTDPFKTGQYSTVNHSNYGLATRTWLACKYGSDIDTYKQPLDKSFGWCITDGNAPFDNTYGVTGYNANHDRYELNQNGKNVIGLGAYGNQSAYISNMNFVQYYKSSSSGGAEWGNVPLNFQPIYSFAPKTDRYSGGLNVMRCAGSGLSPVLKFDFGYYYMVPFVDYYVLKSTATLSDWNAVTDPANYSTLVDTSKRDDLYTFYTRINSGTYSPDKIIINGIVGYMVHVAWNNDNTYDVTDISFGIRTNTTCQITLIHANDTPIDFAFNDWYDTTDPTQYNIKIDSVFINNRCFSVGSCGIYDGKTSSISSGQFTAQTAILLAGCVDHYATGYTYPTSYCYCYQPVIMGSTDFTVKIFSADSSLPNARRYGIAVSATLSDFGGLDSFREYVRKCCAYFGCYFSEKFYPNATKDWNSTDCFIGTIDDNGVTHGNYTNGTDNDNQRQKTWGDEWSDKTPYKPNKPTPTDEEDKGDLNTHLNSGTYATSAKYYATTEQQITKLIDFINTYAPTDAELTADFKGVNPSDYITNVLFFPFDVNYIGAPSPIYLSVLNTTAIGLKFNPSYGITTYDYGGISIDRYFNDFRDFAPYTKLSLNIPFASTVDLDIGEYYGHTLNIKAVIDFTTGDMLFLIMRDALVVKTVSCNCAIQLPLSALAMGTYQQTLNTLQSNVNINSIQSDANDIMTITNTGVSMIGAAMSTGATTLISNPLNTVVSGTSQRDILAEQAGQINYAIKHTAPSPMTITGGTPCNMAMLEYIPRYTITRCKSLNLINYDTFAKTTGFATAQQGRVSDFSGFIVCSDIEFDNISATATEQDAIKNLLKGGVVV